MDRSGKDALLLGVLGFLSRAPAEVQRRFRESATAVRAPAGSLLLSPGAACRSVLFLAGGGVRVYQVGEGGRELTLYRIGPGESCVLTVSCLLGSTAFPVNARVEASASAFAVPAEVFRDWVASTAFWREYAFGLIGRRLAEVLARLDAVAFQRIDARLAAVLLARGNREIRVTHQALADEIGTAREVVSRTLSAFAGQGWCVLERGRIEITNPEAFRRLCDHVTDAAGPKG
jgi:CRP/FNR family transcriptional regulator, anaerobic regulatory protein